MIGCKRIKYLVMMFVLAVCLIGCRTTRSLESNSALQQKKAMISVGEAMTGKNLSDKQVKELERKVVTDPQARSAVETISSSLNGQHPQANYCPIDGKRYAPSITICP